jgi:hypothetical protein
MSAVLQLQAIKFNHDPTSAKTDALNIRKNATQFVTVPEWQNGTSVLPEDSPAAYALQETQGNTITIRAQFMRLDPKIMQAEIRALDPTVHPPAPNGCIAFILWLIQALIQALFGNVLGEVVATVVAFQSNGLSDFVTFPLQNVRIWSVGVGIHITTWRWQYRLKGGKWTDFATSRHKIYTVLASPTATWQQTPYNSSNTQLPWTDVLDYACSWAIGAGTLDDAGAGVTRGIYNLGPSAVVYDCPGGGASHYTDWSTGQFDCTSFLERVRGGIGNGQYVNCTDCATFVSTFANVLGCDLWQSQMGYDFALNELLAIGSTVWQTACNWGSFSYHEVAWKATCLASDAVFDGCLQVDGGPDPTTPPHTPLLPTNLIFGNPGDLLYRDRLAAPSGRASCNPQPSTRQRRPVI